VLGFPDLADRADQGFGLPLAPGRQLPFGQDGRD
jgi:hypothetical protein